MRQNWPASHSVSWKGPEPIEGISSKALISFSGLPSSGPQTCSGRIGMYGGTVGAKVGSVDFQTRVYGSGVSKVGSNGR